MGQISPLKKTRCESFMARKSIDPIELERNRVKSIIRGQSDQVNFSNLTTQARNSPVKTRRYHLIQPGDHSSLGHRGHHIQRTMDNRDKQNVMLNLDHLELKKKLEKVTNNNRTDITGTDSYPGGSRSPFSPIIRSGN